MSRTVIALVGIGAVVIAAALAVAWRVKMNDQAAIEAAKPAPPSTASSALAPQSPLAPPSAQQTVLGTDLGDELQMRPVTRVQLGRAGARERHEILERLLQVAGHAEVVGEQVLDAQPALHLVGAGLGQDNAQTGVAFEDAPAEQIDKRFQEIVQEALRTFEHARRFASRSIADL